MDGRKPATPASYADFGDEQPPGLLRAIIQFFAIPLLIVCVAVGLYVGINLMIGSGPESAADFVQLLQSDTINRRWQAAYELAVRLSAEEVPDEFRDPALVNALCQALTSAREEREEPPRLSILVLRILRRLEDPAALETVRAALEDENDWVRAHSILVLAALDDDASRPRFKELARHDDPGTRQAALEALAMLDQLEGTAFRLSQETRDVALAHLGDPKEDVRFTAALVLADAGARSDALPVLKKMLDRSYLDQFDFNDQWGGLSAYKVRSRTLLKAIAVVEKLDCGDDAQVLDALRRLRSDAYEGDLDVRMAADRALAKLQPKN